MGKKKNKVIKPISTTSVPSKKNDTGPRKYAFEAPVSTSGPSPNEEDPTVLKVTLPVNLEKTIVKEILDFKRAQADYRSVSKRLTTKKLSDLYNSLSSVGFKHAQITDAMKNTIGLGGDLNDALDWLCLNSTNDELPDGFSDKFAMELKDKDKVRARFQEEEKRPVPVRSRAKEKTQAVDPPMETGEVEKEVSLKEWTLRYAEECSSSDDSDENQDERSKGPTQEIDPNEKYLEITALLFDCQTLAQDAKKQGDSKLQKEVGRKIANYQKERRKLEQHADFDPRVKISAGENEGKSGAKIPVEISASENEGKYTAKILPNAKAGKPANGEANDDVDGIVGTMSLFASAEEEAAKPVKPKPKKVPPKDDIRDFEYTRQTWTGKSPKQFLIDWCRKNYPKGNAPKYNKISVRNHWKCKVTVERGKDNPLTVCPDILTLTGMEAQHLASILAMYRLAPGQSIHQLLPPPYRDVWLEWMSADKEAKEARKTEQNKPRDQFVGQLLQQIKSKSESSTKPKSEVPDDGELDTWEDLSDSGDEGSSHRGRHHFQLSNERLKALLKEKQNSEQCRKLQPVRRSLPVSSYRDNILDVLQGHPVILIAGETGSGKSTQIPQFVLEDILNSGRGSDSFILCTQPRRISAMSLANRVAQEIGDKGPGEKDSLCGYQIRFESKRSAATRLLYCTTGVLLRKLQLDPKLQNVSHVIVDEVHERSVQSDFLLIILRKLLQTRKELKVLLMSATMESEKFSAYFQRCPVINIPGRTFPVQVYHIEDAVEFTNYELDSDSPYAVRSANVTEQTQEVKVSGMKGQSSKVKVHWETEKEDSPKEFSLNPDKYSDRTQRCLSRMHPSKINIELIIELLVHLDRDPVYSKIDGAVLVFFPGLSHIQELYEQLEAHKTFSNPARYLLIALHSMLSSSNQSSAFDVPPKGVRKIVLATNIAETGITIPDAVFVIDTGKVKENRYNEQRKMSSLEEVFISQASAKQRQGRAGRVREGVCFRMYTSWKYTQFRSYSQPEIQRVPLEELCLHILKCEFGQPETFLQEAVDPPESLAVRNAMKLLREVGACTLTEVPILTPLGHHLSALPLNVRVGKMLVYATLFGCLEPVSVIAAAMTDKSPFIVPLEKRDKANEAKRAMSIAASDHLTLFKAYSGWKLAQRKGHREAMSFCKKNFLSRNNLLNIENAAKDLQRLIRSCGLVNDTSTKRVNPEAVYLPGTDVLKISHMDISPFEKFPLNPGNIALVKAVLTAGLYPNVARLWYDPPIDGVRDFSVLTQVDTVRESAWLHPGSVNRNLGAYGWVTFIEKVKQSRVFLRDSTMVSPYPILLFGGDISVQHREQLICVDGWIKFQAPAKTAVIFKELRKLLDSLLSRKLADPTLPIQDEKIIQDLLELLQSEGSR